MTQDPGTSEHRHIGDLMIREFDQAWSHYRHIETTRNQYLGFFFTAVLGGLGLITATLNTSTSTARLGAMGMAYTLFWLAFFLFTSIIKMGAVLRGYDRVMATARSFFYEHATPAERSYTDRIGVRVTDDPLMGSRLFGAQRSAEMILRTACAATWAGLMTGAMWFLNSAAPVLYVVAALIMAVTGAAAFVYLEASLLFGRRRVGRRPT